MTTAFLTYGVAPTGASTPRSVPDQLADIINVKDYLPLGQPDGTTDNRSGIQLAIDAAFGSMAAPHGDMNRISPPPGQYANKILYFPPGHYIITSVLLLPPTLGGHIVGSGSAATVIENTTAGASVVACDGWTYSTVEGLTFRGNNGNVAFHYKDDNDHPATVITGNQECAFIDCAYENCGYGLAMGGGTAPMPMGSESLIVNNRFTNCTYGLITQGHNALQQTILGGTFINCGSGSTGAGLFLGSGAAPIIHGCQFSGSTNYDISISGGGNEIHHIAGCISTSNNFLYNDTLNSTVLENCRHTAASNGIFIWNNNIPMIVKGCYSSKGQFIVKAGMRIRMTNCVFDRSDWLGVDPYVHEPASGGNTGGYLELENLTVGTPITHIRRQRVYATPDGFGLLTSNYAVSP
jgi:hypothetical protein